ncbi:TPA: O148 family O-antigen flippase [Escherichia coli]|nr:O148 family O-antigen flippase [Escherichia coli]
MKKNILLLFLVHGANYLFPFIVLPYQTRILSIETFADVAKIQAAVMLLSLIVNYGYNLSSTRAIARAVSQAEINKIYSETLIVKLLLATICLALGYVYLMYVKEYSLIYPFIISSIYLYGSALFATWLFQGLEKMKAIVIATTIAKLTGVILTFILVKSPNDIDAALFTQNIGMFISGIISIYLVRKNKYATVIYFRLKNIILSLKEAWPFFLSLAATSVYTYFNVILLSFYAGDYVVANFNAADKLRMAAQGLLIPIGQAVFPRLSKLEGYEYSSKLKIYAIRYAIFGVCISAGLVFLGPMLTTIYLGKEYSLSGEYLQSMFLLPAIISISTILSQWMLIPQGKEKILSRIYILGAIFHLLYAFPLVYYYEAWGMVISILFTEVLIVLFMLKAVK